MTTNSNGNLLDDAGNVAVDFVWGNFPMQPNDVRIENGGDLLDATLDNHEIAYAGWNGYPLYTPNSAGEGIPNVVVPNVIGLVTATAKAALEDAGLVVTTASAVTPAVTAVALTDNVVTLSTAASHGYAVGDSVVIAGFVNGVAPADADADINGTYTLTTGTTGSTLKFAKTHADITSHSVTGVTAKVMAKAGTIKTQSLAAGANGVEVGDAITITPYFAS